MGTKGILKIPSNSQVAGNVYIQSVLGVSTTRGVLQNSVLGFSDFSEISGNRKRSGNTNVSGAGFPARAQRIQNGILRNPPGAPNGAFLADRAGIRKVLWKLLGISIFNPDRLGTPHFT